MAIHSRSRGSRSKRGDRAPLPPVKPDNRQWETDMGNGFVRVDNGAPPARLPSESQPVHVGDLPSPKATQTPAPVQIEQAPPVTPSAPKAPPVNWQREFGLGKQA
jgi:hypothetical protein